MVVRVTTACATLWHMANDEKKPSDEQLYRVYLLTYTIVRSGTPIDMGTLSRPLAEIAAAAFGAHDARAENEPQTIEVIVEACWSTINKAMDESA